MAESFSPSEVQDRVEYYKETGNWVDEKQEQEEYTERAIRKLAESIVEHYDDRAGTDEFSTLLRLCQVRIRDETKKERVNELDIPQQDKEEINRLIESGSGIVGTGQAQIPIPNESETEAYSVGNITHRTTSELRTRYG